MSPSRAVPPALLDAPFALRTGLGWRTERQLGGPAYQRLTRGVYSAAGRQRDHGHLIAGLRTVLPPAAVLGGLSAAWAHGVSAARPDQPVEVVLPETARVRRRRELAVRGDALLPGEAVAGPCGPVTSGARTAFDLGRRPRLPPELAVILLDQAQARRITAQPASFVVARLAEAIALVDAVLRATGESVDAVHEIIHRHRGVRGLRALRVVLALADPLAESVPESLVRSRVALAGLPFAVPQHVVRDAGAQFVARVDLGWPQLRLAAEYDGGYHDNPAQFGADRRRDNRLQLAGWRSVHLDAGHLRQPDDLIATLAQAIHLRG